MAKEADGYLFTLLTLSFIPLRSAHRLISSRSACSGDDSYQSSTYFRYDAKGDSNFNSKLYFRDRDDIRKFPIRWYITRREGLVEDSANRMSQFMTEFLDDAVRDSVCATW